MVSLEKRRSGNKTMVIGHVDSFVQCHTSKPIWLSLATKIVTWKFYLLFKFGQDCFVEVCISLFSYFRTYCKNVSHAIPNDIKHFQQAQPQPRSQGLSSYRPLRRARRDPGTRWSRAALTIENIREGSSVIRQFVALSFVKFKVSRCAATDITRDV